MCHQITDVTVRPFLHLLHPTRKSRRELQIPGRDVSDPRWPSSVERFCSVTRLPVRCVFRSCVLEPRRSKQSAPACWQKLYFAQLFGRSKRLCVTDPCVQGVHGAACVNVREVNRFEFSNGAGVDGHAGGSLTLTRSVPGREQLGRVTGGTPDSQTCQSRQSSKSRAAEITATTHANMAEP